jgi:hypothetical protein
MDDHAYPHLSGFLADAAFEVEHEPVATRIARFIELRYHTLSRLFPHDVFSVGQASLDFFDKALTHVEGAPFDEIHGGGKPSVYEANYRSWILSLVRKPLDTPYQPC